MQGDVFITAIKQAANLLYNLGQKDRLDEGEFKKMMGMADVLDSVTKLLVGNPSSPAWDSKVRQL